MLQKDEYINKAIILKRFISQLLPVIYFCVYTPLCLANIIWHGRSHYKLR